MEKQELINQEDTSFRQYEIPECRCEECMKAKDRYVRIIDVERFVDNLNDWD